MTHAYVQSGAQSNSEQDESLCRQHVRIARHLLAQINAPSGRDPIYCFGHALDLFATFQLLDIPSIFIRQDILVSLNAQYAPGRSNTEYYTHLPYIQVHDEIISFWGDDENAAIDHAKAFLRAEMMSHFRGERAPHGIPENASVEDVLSWEIKTRKYTALPYAQNSSATANPAEIARLYAAAIEMDTALCEGRDEVRRI